ncbi:MAG: glucosyl-3-phosphoglycerate synthase [Solirubrobacterales bacterium]|nr:glucosyl-3-phosphoglycerate synthase [Solirubrobacterales bacterium]HMT04336.1 glucosyl-3-phosphoglycerate synthase [Solirubrobacterales bacterium]
MTMLDTFDHTDFSATDIARKLRGTVSVVIPTRNTAGTIAATVAELMMLAEEGLVSQILVVDADSADGTATVARDAGAEVVSENELADGFGPTLGKGDAMWRAQEVASGDLLVYVDGDIADFGRHYITGLIGPLTEDDRKQFVKGRYRRPFRIGESEEPAGGGRVTELAARPLLSRLAPELLAFDQPLAGEVAVRRELLERIPFTCGYGVEIAMLIDVWNEVGLEGMAQVELGTKRNAHQSLVALSGMSTEVIDTIAATLARIARKDTGVLTPVDGTSPEPILRPAFSSLASSR